MLSEDVTRLIGQTAEVSVMEVEKGAIRKYANAIGEDSPLYWDEEYARKTRYGGMVAPPGFYGWPTRWTGNMPALTEIMDLLVGTMAKAGYPRFLDGGTEYDFLCPVRAGDTLAALSRVISIQERQTKTGTLVFSVIETTYTNQAGNVAAKARQTFIHR